MKDEPHPFLTYIIIVISQRTSQMAAEEAWSNEDLNDCPSIVACNYLKWRLLKNDFDWEDCPQLLSPNDRLLKFRSFVFKCEIDSSHSLNDLVVRLNLSHQTTYPDFLRISEKLFTNNDGEITWERAGCLYAFTGLCAIYCIHNELWTVIGLLTDWSTIFVDVKLKDWIDSNGGWDKCLENVLVMR